MVGHTLARLFASILEQLSSWAETSSIRAVGQAGFRCGFCRSEPLFKEVDHRERESAADLWIFVKHLRLCSETLLRRLQKLGVHTELNWGIMTLYRSIKGQVRTPRGLSDVLHFPFGVKQGCPFSPTLFGMYIDEAS